MTVYLEGGTNACGIRKGSVFFIDLALFVFPLHGLNDPRPALQTPALGVTILGHPKTPQPCSQRRYLRTCSRRPYQQQRLLQTLRLRVRRESHLRFQQHHQQQQQSPLGHRGLKQQRLWAQQRLKQRIRQRRWRLEWRQQDSPMITHP